MQRKCNTTVLKPVDHSNIGLTSDNADSLRVNPTDHTQGLHRAEPWVFWAFVKKHSTLRLVFAGKFLSIRQLGRFEPVGRIAACHVSIGWTSIIRGVPAVVIGAYEWLRWVLVPMTCKEHEPRDATKIFSSLIMLLRRGTGAACLPWQN